MFRLNERSGGVPLTERRNRYGAIVIYPGFRNFMAVATTEIKRLLKKRGVPTKNIRVEDTLFSQKLNVHVALFSLPQSKFPLYNDAKSRAKSMVEER